MNFKQLIASGGMLVFATAVVVGGTGAFFSDTEEVTGNVFTAGAVSINLGIFSHEYQGDSNPDPDNVTGFNLNNGSFTFADLKPGDWGRITTDITNADNEAHLCMTVGNIEFIDDGDINKASSTALFNLLELYGTSTEMISVDLGVSTSTWVSLGTIGAGDNETVTKAVDLSYCFGENATFGGDGVIDGCTVDTTGDTDYNAAQKGSFTADLLFYAVQSRNNDGFDCEDLND